MKTVKRTDFKGFTLKLFKMKIEFVFHKLKLVCVAIDRKNKNTFRLIDKIE